MVHLQGVISTSFAITEASNSGSIKSISILRERQPEQAFVVAEIGNPTNLPVNIDFDDTYSVSLGNFAATGLISGSDEATMEPHESVQFKLIITLTEGWTAEDSNLTIRIAGEIELSASYLWVHNTQEKSLNITEYYHLFE